MSNPTNLHGSNTDTVGCLYIVATPIGNLSDMSYRAVEILNQVDLIAAEDTRHSAVLLERYLIRTKMVSFHEHNEAGKTPLLLEKVRQGQNIALISDAGTPLISDPGYSIVKEAHTLGIRVIPVPGASALIAALSSSGIATDAFVFAGFLPAKQSNRLRVLKSYQREAKTILFYESNHRIVQAIADMSTVFGGQRNVTVAREMTKKYETIVRSDLAGISTLLAENSNFLKGEFVLVVAGNDESNDVDEQGLTEALDIALEALSVSRAAELLAKLTGQSRRSIYQRALARKK